MGSALDHLAFSLPGQGGFALASAPSSAWMRGCSPILIVFSIHSDALVRLCISFILWLLERGPAFLLHLLLTVLWKSLLVRALHLNLQLNTHCLGSICLHLHSPCSSFMARKRGRPRRGAAEQMSLCYYVSMLLLLALYICWFPIIDSILCGSIPTLLYTLLFLLI